MILGIRQADDTWKNYPMVDLVEFTERLSLNQLMAFNRELALTNISSARSMSYVLELVRKVSGAIGEGMVQPRELVAHEDGVFLMAVMVWGARTYAGERLSLLEACDVPLNRIRFVPDGSDRVDADDPKAEDADA